MYDGSCHSSNVLKCYFFQIFSFDECSKIEGHAPGYKRRFSKIDVLSIYKHVARLSSKKCILMVKLDIWITKAKEVREKADVRD